MNRKKNNYKDLIYAIQTNNLGVVKSILELEADDKRVVDPSYNDNYAFKIALLDSHVSIVEELLQDERVDPGVWYNDAIEKFSRHGYLSIVDRLLKDERVNPADNYNIAIRSASRFGHLAVVERLLKDKRVNPADDYNAAIKVASEHGHLTVVDILLKDERVNPSDYDNYAIHMAGLNEHFDVVNRLAFDHRTSDCSRLPKYRRMIYLHSLGVVLPLFSPSFERVSLSIPIDIVIKIIQYESALTSKELRKIYDIIINVI